MLAALRASVPRAGCTSQPRSDPAGPAGNVIEIDAAHQQQCMPSSSVSRTSVSKPRIVRVTGATIISLRWSITSSRVSTRTGRRLSGSRNVYQRISPRINGTHPIRPRPMPAVPVAIRKLVAGRRRRLVSRRIRSSGSSDLFEQIDAFTLSERRHQRHYVVSGQQMRHQLNSIKR